jgi:hypothetical protein
MCGVMVVVQGIFTSKEDSDPDTLSQGSKTCEKTKSNKQTGRVPHTI